jgi:hypothetical protein
MSEKLTCTAHNRRIMVVEKGVMHMEDNTVCLSPTITIKGHTITPDEFRGVTSEPTGLIVPTVHYGKAHLRPVRETITMRRDHE